MHECSFQSQSNSQHEDTLSMLGSVFEELQHEKSLDPNEKNGPKEDVEEEKRVPPVPTDFESIPMFQSKLVSEYFPLTSWLCNLVQWHTSSLASTINLDANVLIFSSVTPITYCNVCVKGADMEDMYHSSWHVEHVGQLFDNQPATTTQGITW